MSGWRKTGLGVMAALSLSGAVGGAAMAVTQLPMCQQETAIIAYQDGELCSSHGELEHELMLGFSGDAEMSYDEVATSLLESMDLVDVGDSYSTRDLQRLAINPSVPEDSRLAAQELLADPILLNSMDAAGDQQVNREITAEDLTRFAELEPDAGAFTFAELGTHLGQKVEDTNAFEYFDSLGEEDEAFDRQDLLSVLEDPTAPEVFREVAGEFLDYENLFNGFDVARAAFRPGVEDYASGRQQLDGVISKADVTQVGYSSVPEQGDQWTNLHHESLARIAAGGELAPDLFTAFRQTDQGNCVTTAIIKAAMDHYGGDVLKEFSPNAVGGYDIVMQDGFSLSLTGEELEATATETHFAGEDNDTKAYATLLFSSAAKRTQLEGYHGSTTYSQALLNLNDGENPNAIPHFLGLGDLVKPLELSEVPGQDGAVVYGGGHAYYVDTVDGETLGDRWGQPTEYLARAFVNEGDASDAGYTFTPNP